METALNTLSYLPENKKQIETFKQSFIEALENESNPIEIARRVKCVVETFKSISDDILYKDIIIQALEREGGKTTINGAKIEKVEAGTKYDFTVCNDEVWNNLESSIKELTEQKKNRETFLKSLANQVEEVFGGDGIELMPPLKTSSTTVKITL